MPIFLTGKGWEDMADSGQGRNKGRVRLVESITGYKPIRKLSTELKKLYNSVESFYRAQVVGPRVS